MPALHRRRALLAAVAVLAPVSAVTYAVAVRHEGFVLTSRRATRTIAPGASATYSLRVHRTRRTRGWVRMRVRGLPPGARAEWRRQGVAVDHIMRHGGRKIRLRVLTTQSTPVGDYPLRIRARHRKRRARVQVVLHLRRLPLGVSGDLDAALAPGVAVPLDVTFTNPHKQTVRLSVLRVSVDPSTSTPACDGATNFAVTQMDPAALPLPPGTSRLSTLVADPARWPRVQMLALPVSQDACQNTTLTLHYHAEATR